MGNDVIDDYLTRFQVFRSTAPFTAREGRGITHPRAGHSQFTAQDLFKGRGLEGDVPRYRADVDEGPRLFDEAWKLSLKEVDAGRFKGVVNEAMFFEISRDICRLGIDDFISAELLGQIELSLVDVDDVAPFDALGCKTCMVKIPMVPQP